MKTFIAKIEIPYLHSDNPMYEIFNRDRTWYQKNPITPKIKALMGLEHEAYFQLTLSEQSIVSMKRLPDQKWGTLEEKPGFEPLVEKEKIEEKPVDENLH